jgi:DNA-binding SARP family transcriptional activator
MTSALTLPHTIHTHRALDAVPMPLRKANMNDPLEIITLGGLDIRVGGEPITAFESRKVEALLVYLACTARPQSRDVLADLLWDDLSQTRAMANLRGVLYDLRQRLRPYLDVTRNTIALNQEAATWLDVAALERTLDDVSEQGGLISSAAVEQVEGALALYRGDFLAGFHVRACRGFEEWMRVEQERLRGLVVETLHELMAHHLDNGAYKTALAHARRLLELDPESEAAHRGVMAGLACTGHRAAALAQYESCRSLLAEELGVEPEAETTALYEQIRMGEIAPPIEAAAAPRHNLPPQATPFVGRAEEMARIARRLDDPACRLLTLVGPGGCGKTRLAIEAAQQLVAGPPATTQFVNGVFFVPLAAVGTPDSIVPAIASALDFTFYGQGDPIEQLLNYLRRKALLLVLDNFEHLLAPSPPQSPPLGGTEGGRVWCHSSWPPRLPSKSSSPPG